MPIDYGSNNVATSGNVNVSGVVSAISGIFNNLTLNGTTVSISGHTHTASQITDFNEAVDDRIGSGLFVAGTGINLNYNDGSNSFTVNVTGLIANPSGNRILTSRDNTTTGIDAESNLTFDGTTLVCSGNARIGDVQYLDVSNGVLYIRNQDNSPVFSAEEFLLFDNNGAVASLDFNGRHLHDSAQVIVLSWYQPGKIGIRNEAPSYTLDVNGSGNFASGLAVANQTASTIASFDSSKNITSLSTGTYPSLTELSYVKGVTSSIQTQLGNKADNTITITAGSGLAGGGNLSANRSVDIGQGDGIAVSADSIAVNSTVVRTTGSQTISATHTFSGATVFGSNVTVSGNLTMSNQTASTIAAFDGSKNVSSLATATYPSLTELTYVKGVTSAIQTQLNAKQATITGGATTITGSNLTASRALVSDSSGKVAVSTTTAAELAHVSGVTSSIQTQINSKQNTLTNPVTGTGAANHIAYWTSSSGLAHDANQLFWDATNNRLGLGTGSPTYGLHLVGSGYINGFLDVDNLRLDANTISSTNANGNILAQPTGDGCFGINAPSISESFGGKFGVVNGNSYVYACNANFQTLTLGPRKQNDGFSTTLIYPTGLPWAGGQKYWGWDYGHGAMALNYFDGAANNALLTLGSTGGLNIGRQNTSNEGGELRLNRASDNLAMWIMDVFGTGTSPKLRIYDTVSNLERLTILQNGNVGINNANPTSTLDVVGSGNFKNVGSYGIQISPDISTGTHKIFFNGSNINGTIEASENEEVFRIQSDYALHILNESTNIVISAPGSDIMMDGSTLLWNNEPLYRPKSLTTFTPLDNQPPASGFATLDTRNSIAVLDFDDTTEESAVFVGCVSDNFIDFGGIQVKIHWMATSATSGNCRWGVQFEKMNTDADSDSFATAAEAHSATNATNGIPTTTTITITTIDSLVNGDFFRLKIYRDVTDTTNDTMTGDAELIAIELRSVS
jgi:hypothetical protein